MNVQWMERLEKAVEDVKIGVTTPGFTGSYTLEIHASDGIMRDVVKQTKEHYRGK